MMAIKPEEIRELRTKAYLYRACDEPEEHEWCRWWEPAAGATRPERVTILILCSKCGRTPLEMLSELRIQP